MPCQWGNLAEFQYDQSSTQGGWDISFLSKFMALHPGDIICTGTPPGVGCFRKPPHLLVPGYVVECEIDGIGTIVNPVVVARSSGHIRSAAKGETTM